MESNTVIANLKDNIIDSITIKSKDSVTTLNKEVVEALYCILK